MILTGFIIFVLACIIVRLLPYGPAYVHNGHFMERSLSKVQFPFAFLAIGAFIYMLVGFGRWIFS
jgi:hypothetical protein